MNKYSMNTWSLVAGLFLIVNNINGQWRIPADSVYQLIKINSIYKSNANWETIDMQFQTCLQTARGNTDILKCFVKVFEHLKDYNSSFIYKNQTYAYSPVNDPDSMQRIMPLIGRAKNELGKIKTSFIQDKYAYILIPGINSWGEQMNTYAQTIADSIDQYNTTKTKGIIIDLRLNTGGPLAAMLSGLHSLLGNGNIGNEIDENEQVLRSWKIEDGNFIHQGYKYTSIKASSKNLAQMPVVILTGPITRSTGSLTAIAFKNRPKTNFVGEPTANGYTTATSWRQISNELILNLADAFVADRKRRIYPYYVPPDTYVKGGDNFDYFIHDNKIKAAIRWFAKNNYK